jgi:hypothetical protein
VNQPETQINDDYLEKISEDLSAFYPNDFTA